MGGGTEVEHTKAGATGNCDSIVYIMGTLRNSGSHLVCSVLCALYVVALISTEVLS